MILPEQDAKGCCVISAAAFLTMCRSFIGCFTLHEGADIL